MAETENNIKKQKYISVKGAKLHNLKNVSVDIPHNKLTVVTGVSGSGKSTLAFDTIYAEGQRRFVESLSAYARQFLEKMNKPDVDLISGLPPAIAIEQKPAGRNPRSTVGTTTEIYDYFRLLFGRIGETKCRNCGKTVRKDTPSSVAEALLKWEEGTKLYIMFTLSKQARTVNSEIEKYQSKGFFRVIIKKSDEIINLTEQTLPPDLIVDDVCILADRLVLAKDKESVTRLTESIESAFNTSDNRIVIRNLSSGREYSFSSNFECADCEIVYSEPEPKLFSFNNPHGACPACQGFGRTIGIDEDLVIPEKTKSISRGAIHPFRTQGFNIHLRDLLRVASRNKVRVDEPYENLSKEEMDIVWNGAGDYLGINGFFNLLEEKSYKLHYRVLMSRYRGYTTCKACGGSRLRTSARIVYVNGITIPDLIKMPLERVLDFMNNLKLNKYQEQIAGQLVKEIKWRIQLLVDIGLHYITLERLTHTLSGGELQRINLSTALGSSLVGTLYVLDEPSIGMHPRDTDRLMDILYKLRNLGNTIIVVEHDFDIIKKADNIVDMGPAAGEHGGQIIYSGDFDKLSISKESLTGKYLSGQLSIAIPENRSPGSNKFITIHKPRKYNLKIDKVSFPLGCMVAVTGVSGSGKSTLVNDVLYATLKKSYSGIDGTAGSYEKIEGTDWLSYSELVDQAPIGRSSRSTPATFTKSFDFIRELYANTQASRQLGLKPGYFSFNVPGGRCEVCEGEGSVTVDMQFLPDVHLECEACKGTRYSKEARGILFKGKSIVDVLSMTVDAAIEFFKDHKKIVNKLKPLQQVGLGYLRIGQPSTMLSGGESQRIKLASHLDAENSSETLFIFDEPTTGLHIHDISKLLECFRQLISYGHSIIVIEHNIHVIASADWVIDLGPEAGEQGGTIVATGTPEKVASVKSSYTGKALKEFFDNRK
ncbi:MAG: excinuclease ABC subunit A [Ignavibacteria bacterium GWB2_35_12]|nr:MAG: excinuclease ABC subunit A [Ignavibacteria bacterium GWA2_35_8]OGU42403.1 MAG: excinuclease ABC subunit A [Ignavibacteria bacterium GWB2_35_12]OGU97178.1 MAG: excinuclease ABC subunit A [Ignavibacteria bacterium RIFOXYA2_FULL_35_10]OGV19051.1 MAG: excinuclease ABC subunit A [Ignavibacteria bacterium RIFOXYC2_FULL_35_21]